MVHSLFASTDDWDNQLEGTESGWPGFFRILRIYLTHFRGQRSAMMQWMAPAAGTAAEAWETLTAALGLTGLSVGQPWTAPAGVPALSGVVEHLSQSPRQYRPAAARQGRGRRTAALERRQLRRPRSWSRSAFYLYEATRRPAPSPAKHHSGRPGFKNAFPMPAEASTSE